MSSPLFRPLLYAASKRWIKYCASWAMPRVVVLSFPNGEKLALDSHDWRGPSFHMAYGQRDPERALGSYEPHQRSVVESELKKKSTDGSGLLFLDIGANIGLFSFSAKRALPRLSIAAFEPHPITSRCLRETIELNQFTNMTVESIALSDQSGQSHLFLDESDSGGHSLISSNLWNNRKTTQTLEVSLVRLDDWMNARSVQFRTERLAMIKMDVQGAEEAVLRGGLGSLAKFRPALLIEVQHEKVAQEDAVIGALAKLPFQYRVRSMSGEEGTFQDLKSWSAREFGRGVLFADYLFLPV